MLPSEVSVVAARGDVVAAVAAALAPVSVLVLPLVSPMLLPVLVPRPAALPLPAALLMPRPRVSLAARLRGVRALRSAANFRGPAAAGAGDLGATPARAAAAGTAGAAAAAAVVAAAAADPAESLANLARLVAARAVAAEAQGLAGPSIPVLDLDLARAPVPDLVRDPVVPGREPPRRRPSKERLELPAAPTFALTSIAISRIGACMTVGPDGDVCPRLRRARPHQRLHRTRPHQTEGPELSF